MATDWRASAPARGLHDGAPSLALAALWRRRLDGSPADVVKDLSQQLASHCGALHVLVCPHLLRNAVGLLRVNDAAGVILGPQIPLEAQYQQRRRVACCERRPELFDPLRRMELGSGSRASAAVALSYHLLKVGKAESLADIVAKDDKVWVE